MAENINKSLTEKKRRKENKCLITDEKLISKHNNKKEHKHKRKKRRNNFEVTTIGDKLLVNNSEEINMNDNNNKSINNNNVINSDNISTNPSIDLNNKINGNKKVNKRVNKEKPNNDNNNQINSEKNKNHLSDGELHKRFPFLRVLSKEEKRMASEEGLSIKSGKFSAKEDAILRSNWEQFCNDFNVEIPHLVLGFFKHIKDIPPEDKSNSRRLVKESELYFRLGKGLPERTLFSIYNRARKLFSGLNKSDHISEDHRKQILQLYQQFGNQFSVIAEKLMCDIKTVTEVIRTTVKPNGRKLRHGLWDENEDKELINAMKSVLKTNDLKNGFQNISWACVATKMVNRNEVQCRQHFYSSICWQILHPDSQHSNRWNTRYDTSKLIYFLHRNDYQNEYQIEWDLLKEKFKDVVVFSKLCRNWYNLKTSVPDYHLKSYKQIVQWLYENKLKNNIQTQSDWESLEEFCLT